MRKIGLALALILVWTGGVWAAETQETAPDAGAAVSAPAAEVAAPAAAEGLEVLEGEIATGMENRQPVGTADKFPAAVGKVFCYTKIAGAAAGSEVVHKWLKGGEAMAEVTLKIGGSPWRVYSSKTIVPEATGAWSVEISQDGKVIKTLEFTIE